MLSLANFNLAFNSWFINRFHVWYAFSFCQTLSDDVSLDDLVTLDDPSTGMVFHIVLELMGLYFETPLPVCVIVCVWNLWQPWQSVIMTSCQTDTFGSFVIYFRDPYSEHS